EKTCEAKFYQQVVPLTDRIDYLCPLTNNLCYCLAVEKLLGLEIPPKAQWMRVLLNELTRINSHLVWLGTHALDIGAMSVFLYCFREREDILRLFEMVSGQRMMTSYFRIGGLALEPPIGFFERARDFANRFPSKVDEYENLLTGNPIWMMRTKGVAKITAEDALALGASGPTLRGSGVDFDLRRDMPYSSYERFKFKVPTSTDGDVFARYMCRVQELRESIAIVQQALDGMPEGAIKADAPKVVLPDREKMKTQMEALIYHFKIITEGFAVPAGEALSNDLKVIDERFHLRLHLFAIGKHHFWSIGFDCSFRHAIKRLLHNSNGFAQLLHAAHISREYITIRRSRHLELEPLVAGIRHISP